MQITDKVVCVHCGTTNKLKFHHVSYQPENVIVLCQTCHSKEHVDNKEIPKRPKNFNSKETQYGGQVLKISDEAYEQLKKIQATLPASPALVNIVEEAIEYYFKKISGENKSA